MVEVGGVQEEQDAAWLSLNQMDVQREREREGEVN